MLTTALIAGDQVILHILKKAGLLNREIKVGPPPALARADTRTRTRTRTPSPRRRILAHCCRTHALSPHLCRES